MDTTINIVPTNPASGSQRSSSSAPAVEGGRDLPPAAPARGQELPPAADRAGQRTMAEKQVEQGNPADLTAQVEDAVQRINEFVQVVQRDLQFTVDDSTGRTVVKVFDSQSEELIRQLPPDELLAVAEYMDEVRGMLVKEKA
ncbi:flagellar protein FlaG [Ectothiorhodospira haloalkaliphila]|uniref:flagellar protein FlaG n=1 Tax=Ectothiorhodospira haloalkaliphila TaxID=421628 RepID=UPI001EE7E845|nr:flagellar protein FlaG [Ectothiorhodospira haloalkaliphila]MCG5524768.1 flagellar protein FlaG [Ectothiorhodospira haloalkaliphila]